MAEENETVADIIAEMRAREDLDGGDMVDNFDIYNGEYGGWDALMLIKAYADRLEAAHKRERGDCAKLREAASYLTSIFDCDIQFLERHAKELRDTGAYGGGIIEHILHSITLARAALAAPPRNCDVYNNESCRMAYHLHGDGLMTMQAFADWLFAPATEKEGGAK